MIVAWVKIALDFLKGLPWQVYAGLGAVLLVWIALAAHADAVAGVRKQALREGAEATVALFRARQEEADRLAQVGVKVVETKQGTIAREKSDALYDAHDAIDDRARAIRVRHDAKAATRDRARSAGALPAARGAPGEPCPPASEDGLPWSVALPLMTQAAKDQAQLNAILDFEEAQQALAKEGTPLGATEAK